jgi:hypothetical protein
MFIYSTHFHSISSRYTIAISTNIYLHTSTSLSPLTPHSLSELLLLLLLRPLNQTLQLRIPHLHELLTLAQDGDDPEEMRHPLPLHQFRIHAFFFELFVEPDCFSVFG